MNSYPGSQGGHLEEAGLQLALPGRRGTSETAGGGLWELGSPLHPAGTQPVSLSLSSSSLWWPEEAPEQLRFGSFMGKRYMTHHIPPSEAATLPVGCEPSLERFPSLSP